jgi:hypothetical protein
MTSNQGELDLPTVERWPQLMALEKKGQCHSEESCAAAAPDIMATYAPKARCRHGKVASSQ